MKFNLKNLPYCKNCPSWKEDKKGNARCYNFSKWQFAQCNPMMEWLEGFEKELRKRMDLAKKYESCPPLQTEICCFHEILVEILGK